MPGPKKTPTALSLVKGNPGRRPVNENEPKPPPVKNLRCPPGMSKDARREYRRAAKMLTPIGLFTDADTRALEIYAETYAQWKEATKMVDGAGMVVRSPSGYPMQNPYLSIANAAAKRMLSQLGEFGMTPSSRTQLTVGDKKPKQKGNTFSGLR